MGDLELIREALKDWEKGVLDEWTCLFIINMVVNPQQCKDEMRAWVEKAIKADEQNNKYDESLELG